MDFLLQKLAIIVVGLIGTSSVGLLTHTAIRKKKKNNNIELAGT